MRRAIAYLLPFVCLLIIRAGQAQDLTILPTDDPSTISLSGETANNTSACFAAGSPSYCLKPLPSLQTSPTNQQPQYMVQTIVVDAFPEHISSISLKRLLYQNWSGQLICEYQPWFDNGGNSHIDVGYNENSQATVAFQDTKMISRGCNINLIDFDGQSTRPTNSTCKRRIMCTRIYPGAARFR